VKYPAEISLERLKKFGSEIQKQYPNEAPRELLQGQISFGPAEPQTQSTRTMLGYIFHSVDRRQAVQARLDGFTFSRFAPYEDWPRLLSETKRLWNLFVNLVQPSEVTRVAVRYINQINLPLRDGALRFEDYLRTFPEIKGLDEGVILEQFFVRLVLPQPDLDSKLVLTEALLPQQGDYLGVILDIDLFKENVTLDVRSQEIWGILEMFRSRKNKYFEASITDAARGLFA
jgi:uncharacterized protein (TIGR04255 family)